MRLFVAIEVPDDLREALESDVVGALRSSLPSARWTRPEGRHLTLKFLGETDAALLSGISSSLGEAASLHAAFEASFDRVGGFPNLQRPRVLWAGIGPGAAEMSAVARSVDESLEGFPKESRPFAAHLTLARLKTPSPVGELPSVTVPPGRFPVGEIVLFQSQLHPKGARYTALDRFRLSGS